MDPKDAKNVPAELKEKIRKEELNKGNKLDDHSYPSRWQNSAGVYVP